MSMSLFNKKNKNKTKSCYEQHWDGFQNLTGILQVIKKIFSVDFFPVQ